MKPWLLLGLCLSPSAFIGIAAVCVCVYDLRRDRRACQRIVTLTERDQAERFRSGAAFAEAMALQLDEIFGLPECEPWRRWLPR